MTQEKRGFYYDHHHYHGCYLAGDRSFREHDINGKLDIMEHHRVCSKDGASSQTKLHPGCHSIGSWQIAIFRGLD